jgi:hypothetical protein
LIDQRGLAVVDVRNDGDVTNLVHVAGFVGQPVRLPRKEGEAPTLQLSEREYGSDPRARQLRRLAKAEFAKK